MLTLKHCWKQQIRLASFLFICDHKRDTESYYICHSEDYFPVSLCSFPFSETFFFLPTSSQLITSLLFHWENRSSQKTTASSSYHQIDLLTCICSYMLLLPSLTMTDLCSFTGQTPFFCNASFVYLATHVSICSTPVMDLCLSSLLNHYISFFNDLGGHSHQQINIP